MAMPVYAMSCFRLTKSQCQNITSAMSNFWWNACADKHKMHWVSWEKLCRSKDSGGLGFRDIGRFNQALLAKQAWRLLDVPQSLLSRIYKAKYFPHSSLVDAKFGYRPSYAWRSIMFGKELLSRGLMSSIGDGKDTSIWIDNWIFDTAPRRPASRDLMMNISLKVDSLINGYGDWNVPRLHELFLPSDVTRILSFPPQIGKQDKLVWAYTRSGQYEVKSGNWLLTKEADMVGGINHTDNLVNIVKKRVWKLNTAPKIQLFWWRALSGALAVAECLQRHGLTVPTLCSFCLGSVESINHVLFKCSLAARVWSLFGFPLTFSGFSDSVVQNINLLLSMMQRQDIEGKKRDAIPWVLWEIWKARNGLKYANLSSEPNCVLATAFSEAEEWINQAILQKLELTRVNHGNSVHSAHWLKPTMGVVKCNIHASWRNDCLHCGGAWLARNHEGDVLFHARNTLLPTSNRLNAELQVILWCLLSLRDLHLANIEIWTDYGAAVQALKSPSSWPKYRAVTSRIFQVMQTIGVCSIHYSSLKANSLARDIACSVTREGRWNSYLARGGPVWLHDRINQERLRS